MTTQEYKGMYDFALLTKQQLGDIGFTVDLTTVKGFHDKTERIRFDNV